MLGESETVLGYRTGEKAQQYFHLISVSDFDNVRRFIVLYAFAAAAVRLRERKRAHEGEKSERAKKIEKIAYFACILSFFFSSLKSLSSLEQCDETFV